MAPTASLPLSARTLFPPHLSQLVFLVILISGFLSQGFCYVVRYHEGHNSSSLPEVRKYPGEKIEWRECGISYHRGNSDRELECSEIEVPMDQFNPENSGDRTFKIAMMRMRGLNATENLFLNPGGPGGSGIDFLRKAAPSLNKIVGENYHLLSFDPRGVGRSTAVTDRKLRRFALDQRDKVILDGPRDFTTAQIFVKQCAKKMGVYGKYINTPQTAVDMYVYVHLFRYHSLCTKNLAKAVQIIFRVSGSPLTLCRNSILDAVGQKDMLYWGFSYGTLLGQTYATMYPERSKRIILDGVVNQFEWYGGNVHGEYLADSDNMLLGFVKECVKAGEDCPLSPITNSEDQLRGKIMSVINSLREEPVVVWLNEDDHRIITHEWFLMILFRQMYSPSRAWRVYADHLAHWLNGNATVTAAFSDYMGIPEKFTDWLPSCNILLTVELNDAKSGPKYWAKDRKSSLAKFQAFMNESVFTPLLIDRQYARQLWAIPHTHSFVPKTGVKTAHPLLILSTTFDPVTPLSSAKSANDAFEGSQIVEVGGYGHCSLSLPSKCVINHVRQFLDNGTLPYHHTKCEKHPDVVYFPHKNGSIPAQRFDDPDDERIHLAQLELAEQMAERVGLC